MKLFKRSQVALLVMAAMSLQTMIIPTSIKAMQIESKGEPGEAIKEAPFTGTPFTSESGKVIEGLEEAVSKEGKRHWLEATEAGSSTATYSEEAGVLTLQNEYIQREFKIPEVGGTAFYTQSYKNTYTEQEFIKEGSMAPDAYLGLYDGDYFTAYEAKSIKRTPDYMYIGGDTAENNLTNTFVFDHYEVFETCEEPFAWTPDPRYGSPVAQDWPPQGVRVEFYFNAPSECKEIFKETKVKVIYEMYDGIPAMKKRVEIVNGSEETITIGKIAPEVIDAKEEMKDQIHLETTYTCGTESTIPINTELPCGDKKEGEDSPFDGLYGKAHTCYEIGPGYEINQQEDFVSFDTYELLFSTYWFELNSKEIKGMYEKLFPWTTDNPLTFHNTGRLTKEAIDHAVSAGFEMIIQSYGSWDVGGSESMLTRDPAKLDYYKEVVEYAHSQGIAIGIYQAQYTLGQYRDKGASYGSNNEGTWGTWCMATAAFDDYYDNFKYFVEYTGIDCVEIDGAYPGCACGNGELHVNEDKETDPNPEGTDDQIGTPSKYKVHNGYFDSTVKQWENAVKRLCMDMRDMGVYIKVPAWYYLNGGNKGAIGYEEVAWSQPRKEQLIYGRQIMHNSGYGKKLSQSWSHIPFAQYHGGGSDAMFSPFVKNIEDYNWVLAQNLGNGVASDYRGQFLYEDDGGVSQKVMKKWTEFYKKYRGIIDSDLVAIKQATYAEGSDRQTTIGLDTLYHANSKNEGEKGLLWVYNQSDEVRTEIITVPMYYTGLTDMKYPSVPVKGSLGKNVKSYGTWPPNYSWIPAQEANYRMPETTEDQVGNAVFKREGISTEILKIDSNGNALLEVTMQPMSFTYYTIYAENEAPEVEVEVGTVNGVEVTKTTHNEVELKWDKVVELIVREDGVVNPNPAIEIEQFEVYREGVKVGTTRTNTFVDKGLKESEHYTYTIKAVVAGIEGSESIPVVAQTKEDYVKPVVQAVKAVNNETIEIVFDEEIDETTASEGANYSINKGVTVKEVVATGNRIVLTTSPLETLANYQVTIANIKDSSKAGNVMEPVSKTVTCGIMAYYPLNAIKNDKITDQMNQTQADIKNASVVSSTIGKVVNFNGQSTYADLGSGLFNDQEDYALGVWINTNSQEKQTILSQGQENRGLGTSGGIEGNYEVDDFTLEVEKGIVKCTISDISAQKEVKLIASEPITLGNWNHVVVTAEQGEYTLYLNGKEVATKVQEGMDIGTENTLLLGAIKNHAGGSKTNYFKGQMSSVGLYDVAMSKAYIEESYVYSRINLTGIIEGTKILNSEYFTLESIGRLNEAIANLQRMLEQESYEIEEAKELVRAYENAKSELVKKPEYQTLLHSYSFDQINHDVIYDEIGDKIGVTSNSGKMSMYTPFNKGYYVSEKMGNSISINSPFKDQEAYAVTGWFKFEPRSNNMMNPKPYEGSGKQFILSDGDVELFIEADHLNLKVGEAVVKAQLPIAYDELEYETRQAWNHFALMRDQDMFALYQNGEKVASLQAGVVQESEMIKLGDTLNEKITEEHMFNGILDEVQIYNQALTEEEIVSRANRLSFKKAEANNIAIGATLIGQSMQDAYRANDGKVLDLAGADTPWTARLNGDKGKYGYDFGKPMLINGISMTEFYRPYGTDPQIREFERVILVDGEVIFNNDKDGNLGYGIGKDDVFRSFGLGNDIRFEKPIIGQKVEVYYGGFTDQNGKYQPYINVAEIEVYGKEYDENESTEIRFTVGGEKMVELMLGEMKNFEVSAVSENVDLSQHQVTYQIDKPHLVGINPDNHTLIALEMPLNTETVQITAHATIDGIEYESQPLEVRVLNEVDACWKGLSVREGVWTQNEKKELISPVTGKDEALLRKDLKVNEGIVEADIWLSDDENQLQGFILGHGGDISDAAKQQGYQIYLSQNEVMISKSGVGKLVSAQYEAKEGEWVNLKTEFEKNQIKIYVNDELKITYENNVNIKENTYVGLFTSIYPYNEQASSPKYKNFKYNTLNAKSTLEAPSRVIGGEEFTVTIGMRELKEKIYASDFTLEYDADVLTYLGTEKSEGTEIAGLEDNGENIRMLLAHTEGMSEQGDAIKLRFKAKTTTQNVTSNVSINRAQVGAVQDGVSNLTDIEGAQHTITVGKGSIELDKSQLNQVISEAEKILAEAVSGDKPGQYPETAKKQLEGAISTAKQVAENSHSQVEIDGAVTVLRAELEIFKGAQIIGEKEDINEDGIIDVADLALVAYYYRADKDSPNWQEAQKADVDNSGMVDVLDLGQVANQILTR